MKRLIFVCVFCIVSLSAYAELSLTKEGDGLTYILNNLVVDSRYVDDLPWALTIYKIMQPGECRGFNISCPKEAVYLAISDITLDPRQSLYKLNDAYEWKVESVKFDEKKGDKEGALEIKILEKYADDKRAAWGFREHVVIINTNRAVLY